MFSLPVADLKEASTQIVQLSFNECALSPDQRRLVYTDSQGGYERDLRLYLTDLTGETPRQLSELPAVYRPQFTPDGTQILVFESVWPDGPTGHPASNLWQIQIDEREDVQPELIAPYQLFNAPE